MFNSRWKLAFILIIIAGLSYWLLDTLIMDDDEVLAKLAHHPDYYMENFTTLKKTKLTRKFLLFRRINHLQVKETIKIS